MILFSFSTKNEAKDWYESFDLICSEGGGTIVVLADQDKEMMEEYISRDRGFDMRGTEVSGDHS